MAQQETSALFSLNELMRLEEDRVRSEEQLRRAQAEAAERARREAERAARERDAARLRFEEERRQEDERKRQEERARVDAIRAAEIEGARIQAIERARAEALSMQRAHERELAAVAGSKTKTRLRTALWLASASCIALILGLATFYFVRIKPRADEQARAFQTMIQTQQVQRDQMQRDRAEHNLKVAELEQRVRAEQEAARTAAQQPSRPIVGRLPSAHPAQKETSRKAPPCTCDQHDPLCGCWTSR